MKRVILVLLAALMLVSCGQKESNKPYEIIWHAIGTPQRDVDKVMAEVSKYTLDKIGVTVKMTMHDWGDYNQKMQVISASGEPYDLAFTSSWAFDYRNNAGRGAFLPLNDLIDEYGKELKEAIPQALLEGVKLNGEVYAVPTYKEIAFEQVFTVNDTWTNKYNLDLSGVKSLEDLEPFLQIIKENEPDVIPLATYGNTQYLLEGYDFILDGRIPGAVRIDKEGEIKVVNQWEEPAFVNTMKIFRKYYEKGYIAKDAGSVMDNPNLTKTGKWFISVAEYQPGAEILWTESYGYPVSTLPGFTKKPVIATRSLSGAMMAISTHSEEPEKVMQFINLINTDPYLRNLIDSGIENVHYEKIAENRIKNLPSSKDYDMPTFSLGNLFILYLNEHDPEDKWVKFEEWNESAIESPLLGFNFNTNPVRTQLAAISNISQEFGPGLFVGAYDTDEYLKLALDKFDAAGLDIVLNEMQNQIDSWLLTK